VNESLLNHTVLIGDCAPIRQVRADIRAAARSTATVLILGETGVGKEIVSRLIHEQSARQRRRFVVINCGAIPETLLESELFGHMKGSFTGAFHDRPGMIQQAHQGTLFLDELGEMSLRLQTMLLRFAESREVQRVGGYGAARIDARLVTATNCDLRAQVACGRFRADLYYRLNVLQIHVPPLRERGSDITALLDYYLALAAQRHQLPNPALSPEAVQILMAYHWPGNIRELRNIAERLIVQECPGTVKPDDLPPEVLASSRSAARGRVAIRSGSVRSTRRIPLPPESRPVCLPE
jgi:two-component system nitrogen regulation response regulator NtrX